MRVKLECDVFINKSGEVQLHYPDTSLVFELVGKDMYAFDRDDFTVDVFNKGDFKQVLIEYLGVYYYEKFLLDFGNKGLNLCSSFDTHSIKL